MNQADDKRWLGMCFEMMFCRYCRHLQEAADGAAAMTTACSRVVVPFGTKLPLIP